MSLDSAVRAGRAAAERMMTDTVTVSYPTGEMVTDASGREVPEQAVRFTSKCKVQSRSLQARQEEAGGRTATTVTVELHLPMTDATAGAQTDDICEITAVGALSDVALLGKRYRVVAPSSASFKTARRLDVEEVVA